MIEGTVAECDERRVTGFVRFDDPGGNPIELFYGPVLDHKPVVLPTVSSFVTGDMGMGHVIVTGEDGKALLDFQGEQATYEITAGAYWGHKFFPPPAPSPAAPPAPPAPPAA